MRISMLKYFVFLCLKFVVIALIMHQNRQIGQDCYHYIIRFILKTNPTIRNRQCNTLRYAGALTLLLAPIVGIVNKY